MPWNTEYGGRSTDTTGTDELCLDVITYERVIVDRQNRKNIALLCARTRQSQSSDVRMTRSLQDCQLETGDNLLIIDLLLSTFLETYPYVARLAFLPQT